MESQQPKVEQIQLDFNPNRVANSIRKALNCVLVLSAGPENKIISPALLQYLLN
jgi:hypothetical protein